MKYVILIVLGVVCLGCGKDSPKPPEAAILNFPLQNSECTTGIRLNSTTRQVEFRWQAGKFATSYDLKVTNLSTTIPVTLNNISALSANVALQKGVAYSWEVIARNTETEESATSEQWMFYNAGSQTSYAPFPAQIVAPASGGTVVRDINNEITLTWVGADVDNDIQGYEVYLDVVSPPATLVASPTVSLNSIKTSVALDGIHYWKVITIDREGNSSDSGVFSFRVLR
ncbi:MAG: hypothetical protein HKN52_03495 [Eudoraea sp.]|nr:hypothetical protein [Eudoraea sp.]